MFQPNLLQSKRILITGGGTGLGKATARRLLELGATVYICGRREAVLLETARALSSAAPNRMHYFPCDVRDSSAVEAMLDTIWQTGPLNILVNNAAGNILARTEDL